MSFKPVKKQVLEQFDSMIATGGILFVTDTNKEIMWDAYLGGFPEDERQHYNCNCCKQFIRHYGSLVVIVDNKLVTIWDFNPELLFMPSITAMRNLVMASHIRDKFVNDTCKLGTNYNTDTDTQITWEHFYVEAPKSYKVPRKDKDTIMSNFRQIRQVFKRSLDELTLESTDIVLDLIGQGSLYRGNEFEKMVRYFHSCQLVYNTLSPLEQELYSWRVTSEVTNPSMLAIRNTAMGTLLINLSEGQMDLDACVTSWEKVMAPTNYKRPTTLVTKGQVENAEKKIEELGLSDSLGRRFATPEDISVDNVIFVNRNAKPAANVFEELKEEVLVSPKSFNTIEEVTIEKFINEVLPTATGVEVLVENTHLANLVSVIAPVSAESPSLFKWNNPFSWSYVNALTDSLIKERVKAAGGNVAGVIRVSLSWFNFDDLDLWVTEPNGNQIGYDTFKRPSIAPSTGQLDVDMNAGRGTTRQGVENITWTDPNKMMEGTYKVHVNQFSMREREDFGCTVEIEHNGEVFTFDRPEKIHGKILICEFHYDKVKGLSIIGGQSAIVRSIEKWGINTNRFQKVSMIMNSPNHWKQKIGNKHVFFVIEGAKNTETPRGFFNEFLKDELTQERKVFEILGSKLKVTPSDRQVTGVGFSTTQRNSIICKVDGSFKRTLKVTF